jgi:ABC-type multidrug transport system fused ATPase/permease subunit
VPITAARQDLLQRLARRHQRLTHRADRLRTQSRRLAGIRLALFIGGIILVLFMPSPLAAFVVGIAALVIFLFVVRLHQQVQDHLRQLDLSRSILSTHQARATLDWEQLPTPPIYTPEPDHPFEQDLDLTGPRSLHHLLDTCVTTPGSDRLRTWLLTPSPTMQVIQQRHTLLDELTPHFGDRLTLQARLASPRQQRIDPRPITHWIAQAPAPTGLGRLLVVLITLCILTALLFIGFQMGSLPPLFALTFVLYAMLSFTRVTAAMQLFSGATQLQDALRSLQTVFSYLEQDHYAQRPHLRQLCAPFLSPDRPSQQLRALSLTVAMGSLQGNILVWALLNMLMPWDLIAAYRLEQQQRQLATMLPAWLEVWYELEALTALRRFAYLNPDYTRPHLQPAGMRLEAVQLGHPLISHDQRVTNPFQLGHTSEIVLITGSNMSGKSSFLRALGINLVLANAGAVVCAESLHVSLFRPFCCIRVTDSLAAGYSYFYAEVRRLKALLDALHHPAQPPLFSLIDEIFKGTNNRERLLGSQAYLRALQHQPGVALVSTHDLELAQVEGLTHYHFSDTVRDNELHFDYTLRQGISPTTNALRIMQVAGLPVQLDG